MGISIGEIAAFKMEQVGIAKTILKSCLKSYDYETILDENNPNSEEIAEQVCPICHDFMRESLIHLLACSREALHTLEKQYGDEDDEDEDE